jgi:hypothetical protein
LVLDAFAFLAVHRLFLGAQRHGQGGKPEAKEHEVAV